MGLIRLLDKDTINKIAAGEVVERPSSVVKELIENAIDAGATNITCEIKDGGKSFIRVTDNGCGFHKEDIEVAFLRHSTSKIANEEDLNNIKSLGFRGEALSSISAVSKVELLSKRKEEFLGNRYVCEGGAVKSFEEAGCPDGTTFIIRELFFNTPARRKFLKTATTEAGYIGDLLNRLAVSHPEIAFRFINQGKTVLFTNGNGSEKDALYSIYGREVAANLIAVNHESDKLSVKGYIGKPVIVRGNRVCENYYINGRYSKASLITKAIEEAYKGYTMQHKYPFTSLHFTFPIEKLDINVHPTKMEVRIADGDYYYNEIFRIVNEALISSNMIVDATLNPVNRREEKKDIIEQQTKLPQSFEINRSKPFFADEIKERVEIKNNLADFKQEVVRETVNYNPEAVREASDYKSVSSVSEHNISSSKPELSIHDTKNQFEQLSFEIKDEFMNDSKAESFRIVGQVFGTYWIVEMKENMFLIDQHAAHEKILYEKTIKRYRSRKMVSQQLFPPIIVSLSLSEEDILNRHLDHFADLGFEIEHFGGREYAINAIPCDLFNYTGEAFFHDVLDQLLSSPIKGDLDFIVDRIATMSCKAAIKGNHSYSMQEAESLIKELLELDNPYHCPHGRPIIITMTKRDLEKKFKRIV